MSNGHNSVALRNIVSEALTAVVTATVGFVSAYTTAAAAITDDVGGEWWNLPFHASNKRKNDTWKSTPRSKRFHAIVDELYAIAKANNYSNPSMILKQLRNIAAQQAEKAKADAEKAKTDAKKAKMSDAARAKMEAKEAADAAAAKSARPTKAQRHAATIQRRVTELAASVDGEKSNWLHLVIGCAVEPLVATQGDKKIFRAELKPQDTVREMIANLTAQLEDMNKSARGAK